MATEISVLPEDDRELIDFPDLIRTLGRYKWSVLAFAVLALIGAAVYCIASRPQYRATLTLLIEAKSNHLEPTQKEIYDPGAGTFEYYASQDEILKSRSVAEHVLDKLKLMDDPDFEKDMAPAPYSPLTWLSSLMKSFGGSKPAENEAQIKRANYVDALQSRLTVDPVIGTQLVKVEYDSFSPDLAARIANEVAEQYIDSALQARLNITRKAVDWLSGKIGDIRGQLEESEKSLQSFRDSQNLVQVGGDRNLMQEQLVDNSKELRDAQLKVTALANSYARIEAAGDDPSRLENVSSLLLDPVVQKASASYLDAQESYRQQEQRYGPKHPAMEQARGRLEAARGSYYQSLRVAAQGIKAQYEIAKQNAAALSAQVASNQEHMRAFDDKSYQASVLQRNVDSNRQLFDTFLRQFKEADLGESFAEVNARVIDPAIAPLKPFKPRTLKMMAIAGACGLLFGVVLAALRHLLNEEIRSAEDLEVITRVPVLGILPLIAKLPRNGSAARAAVESPRSPFAEALRSVQTALMVSEWSKQERHLMVTSSLPFEGKSTVAACLAAGLGTNSRVLLVEADLRRPSLARYLGIKAGSPGLSHLLSGTAQLEDCIHAVPDMPFSLLPAGKTLPNPAEAIASPAFHELIERLGQDYQRIIFDTPPAQVGADALILCKYVPGVVFVVKPDKTTRRAVKHSIGRLRLVHGNLVGCIINQVDPRRHHTYYEAYYYNYE